VKVANERPGAKFDENLRYLPAETGGKAHRVQIYLDITSAIKNRQHLAVTARTSAKEGHL